MFSANTASKAHSNSVRPDTESTWNISCVAQAVISTVVANTNTLRQAWDFGRNRSRSAAGLLKAWSGMDTGNSIGRARESVIQVSTGRARFLKRVSLPW